MIYLDNASTTPLSGDVKDYIVSILDKFGNPSSIHALGVETRAIIDVARYNISKFINANKGDIYFTSGGSASNTLAIKGYVKKNECDILYSPIAHKSIIKCVNSCTNKKTPIPVDENGTIIINELERLCLMSKSPFVIVDYANSEIGTIQNLKNIIKVVHFYKGVVYVDCTASISTIPLDVKNCNIDMCGFAGHKIGALKGVGVFYKKSNINIEPLIYGAQESGLVGGTENILGIASLGYVVSKYDYSTISEYNRNYVYNYIINNIPDAYLIGSIANRVAHNLYICFKGVESEALMLLLDLNEIYISAGSACNSIELKPSYVLEEICIPENDRYSCVRMTFCGSETTRELDFVCEKLKTYVGQLRNMNMK